ncbi:SWR1-complex protein 5 [Cyberlindnera fabianii]|uniref:SWR1-complex protein 5 n=1 Tax=Cyberlindnera fabianii TaxID=36022 RepID=A0A1V2L833_CYBFA|nr:SWR1-complex protein 5 [Cyberlindnera fabianii]
MAEKHKRDEEVEEVEEDKEYNEDEDEDFDPENVHDNDLSGDDDDDDDEQDNSSKRKRKSSKPKNHNEDADFDFDAETEKEVKRANYSKIESSEGGLIKTRHQRAIETHSSTRDFKSVSLLQSGSVDVNDAWKKLMEQSRERLKFRYSADAQEATHSLVASEKIKIKRRYEYAGEMVTEEKWVDRESAEGKAYLNSLKDKEKVESNASKESNDNKEQESDIKSGFQ